MHAPIVAAAGAPPCGRRTQAVIARRTYAQTIARVQCRARPKQLVKPSWATRFYKCFIFDREFADNKGNRVRNSRYVRDNGAGAPSTHCWRNMEQAKLTRRGFLMSFAATAPSQLTLSGCGGEVDR